MELKYGPLKDRAQDALVRASYSPKKLVAIHTGVVLAFGLVLSLLDYFLAEQIGNTGGLSGIGNRATLETLRSMLQMLDMVLLPFWQIGLTAAMLRLASGQTAQPQTLMVGLHSFGPVLRMNILRGMIYMLILFLGAQVATTVYFMTPFSAPVYALIQEAMASGVVDPNAIAANEEVMAELMKAVPFLLAIVMIILIPVFYRLRMMDYALLREPRKGAFYALFQSLAMTRKRCFQLFKLDLRFWWFYLLELVAVTVFYGDVLLAMMGVALPVSASVASFGFALLGMACQLGVYVWKKDLVELTYANAYLALLPDQEPEMDKNDPLV